MITPHLPTKDALIQSVTVTAIDDLIKRIKKWKLDALIELPSHWAETSRYLPAGTTEFPGLVDWSIAPHLREIVDCAHPDSGIRYVTCMKSTQSLFTTTVESAIGWAIKHGLHNILTIISSKNIAKIRSSSAIDVMIDHSGLADRVRPMSERMKKKTGDNTYYKELLGGRRMLMTSWNSIGDAKSVNWSFIFEDELDEAPYELKGQGDPQKIFEGRKKTVKFFMVFRGGTPILTTGRTYTNFLEGDQRYYHVPCPLCGEIQPLVLLAGTDSAVTGSNYGLTARSEMKNSVEVVVEDSVEYICKFCKDRFKEHHKHWMFQPENGALWIPTATPKDPQHRSYHISNLMSPVMFFTWKSFMQEFASTDYGANITRYKNFRIDNLGCPWENRRGKMEWRDVWEKCGNYPLGAVPLGGMIITAGCDVQKRWLELVVVAWGRWPEAWIIDHKKFYGDTANKGNKVWAEMRDYVQTKKYPKQIGEPLSIVMLGVDSAYNPKKDASNAEMTIVDEHTVYEVVASMTPKAIACQGVAGQRDAIAKQQPVKHSNALKVRYEMASDLLKDEFFARFELDDCPIHLTQALGEDFFRGLFSEVWAEVKPGKWEYRKTFERNEPLDGWDLSRMAAEVLGVPSWSSETWDSLYERLYRK